MTFWRQPLDRERVQVPQGIVRIIEERCKGCGICVEFCPRRVLVMSRRTNSRGYHPPEVVIDTDYPRTAAGHCVNCGLCTLLCPDFAIYVENGGFHPPDRIEPAREKETENSSPHAVRGNRRPREV